MTVGLAKTASDASHKLQDHATHLVAQVVDHCDLPEWMQKDVYITHGYRLEENSFHGCYRSLWYLHNETVNVWSHLLTGIFFLSLFLWSALPVLHSGYTFSAGDLLALQSYLVGAIICLFFSAFYHCVCCHSERVAKRCLKLDYLGIVFNITSTCMSATYFGLYDHRQLASFYITLTVICGSMTFWAVLDPNMDGPKAAFWRSVIFIMLGASGFAPIIHVFVSDHMSLANFPLVYIFASSVLYLVGTAFYVSRTPEKHWPGMFNVWGASHQIFHILINIAQISHLLDIHDGEERALLTVPHFTQRERTRLPNLHLCYTTWLYNIDNKNKNGYDFANDALWLGHVVATGNGRLGRFGKIWIIVALVVTDWHQRSKLVFYIAGYAIYNLFFHPLAKFPGPKWWAVSRIPYALSLRRGRWMHRVKDFHDKYGHIVRVAPDELTFTDGATWKDVYQHHHGQKDFPKHGVWLTSMVNGTDSILHANDADHMRIKRLLSHAFSERALRGQEAFVRRYVDLLVRRLKEGIENKEDTVDIVRWFNWTVSDIIGDLTFGESFGCLQDSRNHPWVSKLLFQFKAATTLASCRYFPGMEAVLKFASTNSAKRLRREIFRFAQEKIGKRLEMETDRLDFMTYVKRYNDEKGMSRDEIDSTFTTLIVAGGETTGTFLAGATYYLIQNPNVWHKVAAEIRGAFKSEDEMTSTNIEKLPYFAAVIKEGLRLTPPGGFSHPRIVPKGGGVVAGHFLPGGTVVSVVAWAASRSARNFAAPETFDPERWLQHNGYDDESAYQPFSLGPRGCIGRSMAMLEMRLIMARMIWNFDMRVPGGGTKVDWDWSVQNTYMVWQKRPLYVELEVAEH